jgi:tRNA A37 threonylcarbamoyladenosine modification protein TsaB
MILSYFVRGKEIHISTDGIASVYELSEPRELADKAVVFIKDATAKCSDKNIKKVVYSSGPASFTTLRIINSIAKGMFIAKPSIEFVGISNFLTYVSAAMTKLNANGLVAIPTMRGDYFTCEYLCDTLQNQQIQDMRSISKYSGHVLFDNDLIFDNINLALVQESVADSDLGRNNPTYVTQSIKTEYGFSPKYKF